MSKTETRSSRRSARSALALLATLLQCACQGGPKSSPTPAESAARQARPDANTKNLRRLLSAEHRRDSAAITRQDLEQRDPELRRAAARSLARIADRRAVDKLLGLLRDEDAGVVAWAAYGLGETCQDREKKLVDALTLRAVSWSVHPAKRAGGPAPAPPLSAMASALARCGTAEAEATLRAWLDQPELAPAASYALGNLAARHQRLEAASMVALLDVASRRTQPLDHALLAFVPLSGLESTVQSRLLEVATRMLQSQDTGRGFAVRALGSAGEQAAPVLTPVLVDSKASAADRSAASRALGRLGKAGQLELQKAVASLLPIASDTNRLLSPEFGPLMATLEELEPPVTEAQSALTTLSELPLAQDAAPGVKRRLVSLRCRAAALLAGRASASARLLACDPDPEGELGLLARLSALDRGPITGARLRFWQRLTESERPVVRQAALRLLATHDEVPRAYEVLAKALSSRETGSVATAAQVLAAYPDRATAGAGEARAPAPHPSIIAAFGQSLERTEPLPPVEALSALMDAAGALELLSAKPALERFCKSDQPTLRRHSEAALRRLGDKQRRCDEFPPPAEPPAELAELPTRPTPSKLVLETDVGEFVLELDPRWAPVAVARIASLARAGYFDDMAIHRVVPGFVVQFGDKVGDGFGDGVHPPLRCETSPVAFEAYDVGMALAGRDTASTQLFVTLDRFPRLDGNYALIGRAGPEWQRLAQGDRILEISVKP